MHCSPVLSRPHCFLPYAAEHTSPFTQVHSSPAAVPPALLHCQHASPAIHLPGCVLTPSLRATSRSRISSTSSSLQTDFYFSHRVWTAEKKPPKTQLNIMPVCLLPPLYAGLVVGDWLKPVSELSSLSQENRKGTGSNDPTLSATESRQLPCGVFLLNSSALQLWKWSRFTLGSFIPLFLGNC